MRSSSTKKHSQKQNSSELPTRLKQQIRNCLDALERDLDEAALLYRQLTWTLEELEPATQKRARMYYANLMAARDANSKTQNPRAL